MKAGKTTSKKSTNKNTSKKIKRKITNKNTNKFTNTDKILMKRKSQNPKSYNIYDLIKMSSNSIFKTSVTERASNVGDVYYKGYKFSQYTQNNRLKINVIFYFRVNGAIFNNVRKTYWLAVLLPFSKRIMITNSFYKYTPKLFSSDPSFKYNFAYVLKQNNMLLDNTKNMKMILGEAPFKAPKKKNPNLHLELTKHFYKVFKMFFNNKKINEFLNKKWLLPSGFDIPIVSR